MSRAGVEIDVRLGQVLATVALMPAAVQSAFRERLYDLLSHHRLSVLKHHQLPSKRRAQQMLASRTYRYTRADAAGALGGGLGVVGEGFLAAESGQTYGRDAFKRLEEGGEVSAREAMIIPVGAGRRLALRDRAAWERLLHGDVDLIRAPSGRMLLVRQSIRKGSIKETIYGVLSRRRRQPAQLGYYRQFDSVQGRHVAKLEADLDRAQTAAGQAAIVERAAEGRRLGEAYLAGLRRYLDANPGRLREARAAGVAARKLAKAANTTRDRERA